MSYVVVTRYERPGQRTIVHAYGLYPTRSKASTAMRRMLLDPANEPEIGQLEARVTKLIDLADIRLGKLLTEMAATSDAASASTQAPA